MSRMTKGDRDMVLLGLIVFAIPALVWLAVDSWPAVWAFVQSHKWLVLLGTGALTALGLVLWLNWPCPLDEQRECGADWSKEGER